MAQLKDLIVTGPSRFLNDLYALTIYEGGVKLEDKYYLASNPSGYISDLSTAINGLSVGSSPSQAGDYLVSQYAGGSQTSYHRRPVYLVAQGVLGYTTSGKNYAIAMDSSTHKLYVNVPWTDTTYSAGSGISISTGRSISVTNPVPTGTIDDSVLLWDNDSSEPYWTTPPWTTNTGTVTSVRVQASSPLTSTSSSASTTTLDTTIKFSNQNANLVLAGPSSGSAAAPSFRSLVAADIPSLASSKITNFAADVKTAIGISSGSTYLKKDGSWGTPTDTTYSAGTGISINNNRQISAIRPVPVCDTNGYVLTWDNEEECTWSDPSTLYSAGVGLSKSSTTFSLDPAFGVEFIIGTQTAQTGSWTGVSKQAALYDGMQIAYWLPFAGSGNATLNLTMSNGTTTGAVYCYFGGTSRLTTHFGAGNVIYMTYRSNVNIGGTSYTGWWHNADYNSTNTTQFRQYYTHPVVDSGSDFTVYRYQFILTTKTGTVIPVSNGNDQATTYTKTMTTDAFDPFMPMYYYSYTNTYTAGTTMPSGYMWNFYELFDARYAFNIYASGVAGTTALTANLPVYIKAKYTVSTHTAVLQPNASSSNYLERSSLVQALPSSNPGSDIIYIFIGYAHDKYRINLHGVHPIYRWDPTTNMMAIFSESIYSSKSAASGGTDVSLVTTGEKYTWNNKKGLPSYSSSDRGKFLVVSEGDGSPAWETLYWSDISSTPTTLGGYGITDAKIQNGTITLGSNSITPMSNPMTAANDIIVGGTNGAATKLVKGSNGTFLGINSSGNVAWVDNPVPFNGDNDNDVLMWDGTDEKAFWCAPLWMENLIFNAGEIIIGNSNGKPIALSKGSTGQVLTTTSSGNRVAWQNATVRMNANTGSTALSVLLAPSDVSNGASKEAQYANTSGKQLKFTPSTGNLSGIAQINGSAVPSSPKFTDTLADYITEWNNETEPTGEALGIVKYAYDHTPALYLDSITYSDMVHSWSTSSNIAMLTMTNTYTSNGGSTNPVLTLSSYPVQNSGTVFKLINNTAQSSNNWLSALDIMAPNMTASSNMNYANFTIFNCGKAASNNNRGSLVYHHTADGSLYNCLTMGFYGNDHVFRVYAYGGAWIYGSLYVENGNKVATEAWVSSNFVPTCLIKGTKILMADGTEKNIEDVKRGDEVKSIDINSRKIITAMVISCEKTGLNHEYTTHLFDNGSYIVTYGQHSVYNKTLGHPTDISKFRIGDETYDAEGNVITYAGNMRYYDRSTDVAHYDINTSNNLYFANGILNGKNVFAKYRYMRREEMDIPDSILAVLNRQETANKPAIGYETDSNYFRAIAAKLKEKSTIAKRIEEAKQKLADSDYLVAKFTEGLISAVDWLKAKAERSNWRTAINNDEPLLEAADKAITAIKAKYQTDDSSVKDRFELFSAWDNAALEYYREWLTKIKPIDIPGPLTEEERHGSYVNQDLT